MPFDPSYAYDQVISGYTATVVPAGGTITFDPSYALDEPYQPALAASVGTAGGSIGFDPSFGYDQPYRPVTASSGGTVGGAVSFDPSFAFDEPYYPVAGPVGSVGTITFDPSYGFDEPYAPVTTTSPAPATNPRATRIQSRISYGYAKAGAVLGFPFQHYRCASIGPVLQTTNVVETLNASFAVKGDYTKAGTVKNDEWYGYYNAATALPGDYLSNGTDTYFIAAQQLMLPPLTVKCNRVVTVFRPAQVSTVGVSGYGGNTASTETALMSEWPASVLQGTKGERGDVSVPDDVKSPWYALRMPMLAGVTINSGDIITDDLDRRYTVSSTELTEYGWRLTMRQDLN